MSAFDIIVEGKNSPDIELRMRLDNIDALIYCLVPVKLACLPNLDTIHARMLPWLNNAGRELCELRENGT